MNKIKVLPAHEAQKISAGEVIERPAHLIKELLENALDAGATCIELYLEQAGKKLIRIVDNGCGMSPDDARLCFVKHATSKITSLDDLEKISSFGFRGEALASIAAVSKVTLKTKPKNRELGIAIDYEQGHITNEQSIACPEGTELLVRDLFYNMPARKKFLRQDETEMNQVQNLFYAACLSHLNVHFKLYLDGALTLHAPATHTIHDRVSQLWGYNTTQNLTSLYQEDAHTVGQNWLSITGSTSHGSFWRHSRDRIFFFVNNRWIKNQELSKALMKGYAQALPPGKFPMAFIFMTLQSDHVDINVHPKKEEVRFLRPGIVETTLQKKIQKSLEMHITRMLTPEQSNTPITIPASIPANAPIISFNQNQTTKPKTIEETLNVFQNYSFLRSYPSTSSGRAAISSGRAAISSEQVSIAKTAYSEPVEESVILNQPPLVLALSLSNGSKDTSANTHYKIIGQLFNTYIMIEKPDECVIIDQHAAHERVLYEQWKNNFENLAGVTLLFPEIITMKPHQLTRLTEQQDIFAQLGITLEQFGQQEVIIKTSPPKVNSTDLSSLVQEAAVFLEEHETLNQEDLRKKLFEHMHSHMACKAAVRAGDTLTQAMMQQLINDLLTIENRFQCVHGRPTMWVMPKHDFEKKFRRC